LRIADCGLRIADCGLRIADDLEPEGLVVSSRGVEQIAKR